MEILEKKVLYDGGCRENPNNFRTAGGEVFIFRASSSMECKNNHPGVQGKKVLI